MRRGIALGGLAPEPARKRGKGASAGQARSVTVQRRMEDAVAAVETVRLRRAAQAAQRAIRRAARRLERLELEEAPTYRGTEESRTAGSQAGLGTAATVGPVLRTVQHARNRFSDNFAHYPDALRIGQLTFARLLAEMGDGRPFLDPEVDLSGAGMVVTVYGMTVGVNPLMRDGVVEVGHSAYPDRTVRGTVL